MRKNYGLIGASLSHSKSHILHKNIMEDMGIDGNYSLYEVKPEDLNGVIKALKVLNISGVNVTIPYKQEIMKYIDEVEDKAKKIGAVNTLAIKNNKVIGYNTDYDGFLMTLKLSNIGIEGNSFTVLGSGGASKAIVQALIDYKAKSISIVSRDKTKNNYKYPELQLISYEEIPLIRDKYCLINATPKGTYPDITECPVKETVIKCYKNIVDLIYNPEITTLLKMATKHNINNINGYYMLKIQAQEAQKIWSKVSI